MLALLLACALPPPLEEPSDEGTCPVDPCASGTTSESAAVACCVSKHGYGLDAGAIEVLEYACSGDACDPDLYLSPEAALCAAQAYGLEPGLAECHARFEYRTDGTAVWFVRNVTTECPPEANLCGGGEFVEVDARTGAWLAWGMQSS